MPRPLFTPVLLGALLGATLLAGCKTRTIYADTYSNRRNYFIPPVQQTVATTEVTTGGIPGGGAINPIPVTVPVDPNAPSPASIPGLEPLQPAPAADPAMIPGAAPAAEIPGLAPAGDPGMAPAGDPGMAPLPAGDPAAPAPVPGL